jgi:hypothetical protein
MAQGTSIRVSGRAATIAFASLLCALTAEAPRAGAAPTPYPAMAPIAQYRIASQADEIALARSAAPPSISGDADVMTLGDRGYETAVKGKNGFVCIVERSWANTFGNAEFWNPKVRSPICFNRESARSVLPTYLQVTNWVLEGASQAQMTERTKAAIAAGRIGPPEVGAMCYMMSKDGYLNDDGGHWHPHLMFFLPHDGHGLADWGANLPGVPVAGGDVGLDPASVYFVVVTKWSDGTPWVMGM